MLLIGSLVLFECAACCGSQLNESVSPHRCLHTPSLRRSSCLRLKPKTHWCHLTSVKTPASMNVYVLTPRTSHHCSIFNVADHGRQRFVVCFFILVCFFLREQLFCTSQLPSTLECRCQCVSARQTFCYDFKSLCNLQAKKELLKSGFEVDGFEIESL